MKPRIAIAAACAIGLGTAAFLHATWAQDQGQAQVQGTVPGQTLPSLFELCRNTNIFGTPPIYFPYPNGIIPRDICTEIQRVRREVRGIFDETLAFSRTLPPPNLSNTQGTGNPPTLQGSGYAAVRTLGKLLIVDETMSVGRDEACTF